MTEKSFADSVLEILDCVGDGGEEALKTNADKIHALADYCRNTKLFQESKGQGKEAFDGISPIEIYNHMIVKIVESPTVLHRDGSVILVMPYLSDALKGDE